MNEINIGDEVFIQNFENQKLTVSSFDKENAICIYLNANMEFKSIQVSIDLLIQKDYKPVTIPKKRTKNSDERRFSEFS